MFKECIENVRKNVPLVHNITNYVTVNDVANVLLACGGSPIMSDDIDDVEDLTLTLELLTKTQYLQCLQQERKQTN